jgi:hypothetical protein
MNRLWRIADAEFESRPVTVDPGPVGRYSD